jgi:hypothetical protein
MRSPVMGGNLEFVLIRESQKLFYRSGVRQRRRSHENDPVVCTVLGPASDAYVRNFAGANDFFSDNTCSAWINRNQARPQAALLASSWHFAVCHAEAPANRRKYPHSD